MYALETHSPIFFLDYNYNLHFLGLKTFLFSWFWDIFGSKGRCRYSIGPRCCSKALFSGGKIPTKPPTASKRGHDDSARDSFGGTGTGASGTKATLAQRGATRPLVW